MGSPLAQPSRRWYPGGIAITPYLIRGRTGLLLRRLARVRICRRRPLRRGLVSHYLARSERARARGVDLRCAPLSSGPAGVGHGLF